MESSRRLPSQQQVMLSSTSSFLASDLAQVQMRIPGVTVANVEARGFGTVSVSLEDPHLRSHDDLIM
jgi:hypothetical protein